MKYVKIDGLESKCYKVDVLGNVYNIEGKILTPIPTHDGYLRVRLCRDLPRKLYRVHRIVAETYINNPNNLPVVNHKDNNPTNNTVSNLEWVTVAENNSHKYQFGYGSKAKPVYQYTLEGEFIKAWDTPKQAQQELGIYNISAVARGKRPQAGGFYWTYEMPSVETIDRTTSQGIV